MTASVLAQNAPDDDDDVSGDTIQLEPFTVFSDRDIGYYSADAVTAARLRVPIKELASGVSIINSDLIEDTISTNFDELVFYSASFEDSGSNPGQFTLRGFGASESVDTTRLPGLVPIDPAFIERVEVVKGPQSVHYGIVPAGGLVNIVTKKPYDDNRTTIGFVARHWEDYRITFDHSGVLHKGENFSASYRAVALFQDKDDHFEKFAELELSGIAPSLLLTFNDNRTSVMLQGIFQDWDQKGNDNGFVPFDRDVDQVLPNVSRDFNHQGPFAFTNRGIRYLSGTLTHSFSDAWSLRSHFVYLENLFDTLEPVGVREIAPAGSRRIAPRYQRRGRIDQAGPNDRDINIQTDVVFQPNIQSGAIDDLTIVLGHLYRNTHHDSEVFLGNVVEFSVDENLDEVDFSPIGLADMTFNRQQRNRGTAHQFQSTASFKTFDSRLILSGGTRYISSDSTNATIRDLDNPPDTPTFSFSDVAWQVGGLWKFSENFSFFANTARSVEPNIQFPNDPQQGEGLDFGIKMEGMWDGLLSGSLVYFDLERKNIPRTNFFTRELELSGKEAIQGVEAELFIAPVDGWNTVVTLSFLDHEVASDTQDPEIEGRPLAATPDFSGSVWTNYTFQTGKLEGLRLGLGVVHKGELERLLNGSFFKNLGPIDAWTRLDLLIGYEFAMSNAAAKIALKIENVTNERYFRSPIILGEPTNWAVSFSLSF